MEKPFKSIEEQINLMHRRGLSTDADTPGILMREGYYSIVNGYKGPFLDPDAGGGRRSFRGGDELQRRI